MEDVGAPDLSEVLKDELYLSSMWAAREPAILRRWGITHILCVAEEALGRDGSHPIASNLACADIIVADFDGVDLEDDGGSLLLEVLPRHIRFMDDALLTPRGRCLVHCRLGANRSTTVVLAYLMVRRHMDFEEAWRHTSEHRSGIAIHPNYEQTLRTLPQAWLAGSSAEWQ
mmetsp:Transcript_83824/g.260495  ORF Transcript_83824/g.260495 Transcript_83824/m.260495 type:complete len:172 (-) Transcript_83824:222-737(-)